VLPLMFLTVAFLGGLDPGEARPWSAASPFALLLASLMIVALVRSGALAPERLMHGSRGGLENANGFVVLVTVFVSSAQLLRMLLPQSGLPALLVGLVLLLLLVNTLAAQPDRIRMLRSLGVVIGSAFVLKFILLAALADPAGGRTKRVLLALFDVATLGTVVQAPLHPAAPYLAFFTAVLFLIGIALLPAAHAGRSLRVTALAPGLDVID
jgi:hypothetical protein